MLAAFGGQLLRAPSNNYTKLTISGLHTAESFLLFNYLLTAGQRYCGRWAAVTWPLGSGSAAAGQRPTRKIIFYLKHCH